MQTPVLDLAGLTLEVNHLERAVLFYKSLFGFPLRRHDPQAGVAELLLPSGQRLSLWMPVTRRANDPRLAGLGARGGTHVHYAFQIPRGTQDAARHVLKAHGVVWQEIELGEGDVGLYFFDPFGHGLELREVETDPTDLRHPLVSPQPSGAGDGFLPVAGLREVALAFADFGGMKGRLAEAYGFCFVEEMEERAFAQFVLGADPEKDGGHTPRRWLYCWDPQVGLADMLGGEHATVRFYARVDEVEEKVKAAGLPHLRDAQGLAVRDPEGHVFEFVELPSAGASADD